MSDFVDLLIAEQANPSAALLQILVSDYKNYDVIVAVEGPDDRTFYYDFIAGYAAGNRINILACGGKRGVVGLQSLIDDYDWDYKPIFLYLCDKDFDDYIGNMRAGVYYLPVYSIESFFTTKSYLEYILEKFSKANLSENERQAVIATFEQIVEPMIKSLRLVAVLMMTLRAKGQHPDFDALSVADFLDMSAEKPTSRVGRWTIIRAQWLSAEVGELNGLELRTLANQLAIEDHPKWLRGKYALQLAKAAYLKALKRIPKDVSERCPEANLFSSEAFRWAKLFLVDVECLREYCESLVRSPH